MVELTNVKCEKCTCWGYIKWYEKIDNKYICKECLNNLMEEFK